jgi:hypothetical protein
MVVCLADERTERITQRVKDDSSPCTSNAVEGHARCEGSGRSFSVSL